MDVEAIVEKHAGDRGEYTQMAVESSIRAALTELAAKYEKLIAGDVTVMEAFKDWQGERIGRAALVKAQQAATIDPFELFHAGMMRGLAAGLQRIRQLEDERVPAPSCRECANRGRVNGLSQESYCDSCVWQGQSFRVNHYAPQPKKENV